MELFNFFNIFTYKFSLIIIGVFNVGNVSKLHRIYTKTV